MAGVQTGAAPTFGDLLRRYRARADLTQEDLAERAGLTAQAIGLLERGQRRRPQAYTVRRLAEALQLDGPDLARFESVARRRSTHDGPAGQPSRGLPTPVTPTVGRAYEVATVHALVRRPDVRLVTLTGPGGVGKTRLAVEVARELADGGSDAVADGIVFVPLASLRDPAAVPSTLARALGVREALGLPVLDTVVQHLRDMRMVVVLDNFEHLLIAAPAVGVLVGTCHELTVVVTSRSPLRLTGEHQFPVPPLALPGAATRGVAQAAAVELFRQRACAVAPDFELTDANVATVASICRRVDGLPLAIELAAARLTLFSPNALLARLDRRLRVLVHGARDLPERQQTLRRTIAWSHDLLDDDQQRVFRRLAVFAGGCTLGAAEAVCTTPTDEPHDADVVEHVAALVDNSLVASSAAQAKSDGYGGQPRLAMLETIREYAEECLTSSGEVDAIRRAHALHYLALAQDAQPEQRGVPTEGRWWWAELDVEHDNLRAALRWAIDRGQADVGVRLGLLLWRFWNLSSHLTEGRRWLDALLALDPPEVDVNPITTTAPAARRWAFLHLVAGMLSAAQGDDDHAVTLFEESLNLYRRLGDDKGGGGPLRELGAAAYRRGRYERAKDLNTQALLAARATGSTFGSALALCNLADVARAQGDLHHARTLLEESRATLLSEQDRARLANALSNTLTRLGSVECEMGDAARADALFRDSLGVVWRFGFGIEGVACLEGLARAAAMQDRPERAARLLGASAARREEMGMRLSPLTRVDHDHAAVAARRALGDTAFATAWEDGQQLSLDACIAYALATDDGACTS